MNKVTMKGNLVRDNDFKISQSGTPFLKNSIAITEGKEKKRTDYFNIIAFNQVAEIIADNYKKGTEVHFEGKIQNNNYTNAKGEKVYMNQIVIEHVFGTTNFMQKGAKEDELVPMSDDDLPF